MAIRWRRERPHADPCKHRHLYLQCDETQRTYIRIEYGTIGWNFIVIGPAHVKRQAHGEYNAEGGAKKQAVAWWHKNRDAHLALFGPADGA